MASVYYKESRGTWYARLKDERGRWVDRSLGIQGKKRRAEALSTAHALEAAIQADAPVEDGTIADLVPDWLAARARRGVRSIRHDRGRMTKWILPVFGPCQPGEVRPREIRAFLADLRSSGIAPRTVHNVFTLLRRFFADLEADEIIERTPCRLAHGDLPLVVDKDPEWRSSSRYSKAEAELLISSPLIPEDRRVIYALALFVGPRWGEIAALRWRHLDDRAEPLSCLTIAHSGQHEGTKTGVTHLVPVHPALGVVLARWHGGGWRRQFKRDPKPADLIVPSRMSAEKLRPQQRAWKNVKADLEALGLRSEGRALHAMRRTFVDLARGAGIPKERLEPLTHPGRRSMIDVYGQLPWRQHCEDVASIDLRLLDETACRIAMTGTSGGGADGPDGPRQQGFAATLAAAGPEAVDSHRNSGCGRGDLNPPLTPSGRNEKPKTTGKRKVRRHLKAVKSASSRPPAATAASAPEPPDALDLAMRGLAHAVHALDREPVLPDAEGES